MTAAADRRRPPLALSLGLGALLLMAGVALAHWRLPDWQAAELPPQSFFAQRFVAIARQAGISLGQGSRRIRLAEGLPLASLKPYLPGLDPAGAGALGGGIVIEVDEVGARPAEGAMMRLLTVQLSTQGKAVLLTWIASNPLDFVFFGQTARAARDLAAPFTAPMLAPGESVGEPTSEIFATSSRLLYPIRGSLPPQILRIQAPPTNNLVTAERVPRTGTSEAVQHTRTFKSIRHFLSRLALVLGFVGLFIVLAVRRRIELGEGALAAAACLALSLAVTWPVATGFEIAGSLLSGLFLALFVWVAWSASASLVRATDPGLAATLDPLRRWRLGPRLGRALVEGVALGAAFGGLSLGLQAAAAALPGAWPLAGSIDLPVFAANQNPLITGLMLATTVMALLGVAARLVPPRWQAPAATAAGALLVAPLQLHPFLLELAANLALAGSLVYVARRFGCTALVVGTTASALLPAAVFSAGHLAWLPATFAASGGATAALLALGALGLRRSPDIDERAKPPAFIRRLEEERRLKYEMDLLARMQLGLLPAALPELPGWQIAARSLLADRAGGDLYDFIARGDRFWVAAGDVSGHGYSCSIAQAMTKAALASLVEEGTAPSSVLLGSDRVLRTAGSARNFTSLALLRLDPATGDALLANAGHPPLLVVGPPGAGSEVQELMLPGLPLGQGPPRQYADLRLSVPPGATLIFCSDGLFEATDARGEPYGYERPRAALIAARGLPAAEVLAALLADWRRHIGTEAPPDDTTIVVVQRLGVDADRR